MTRFCDEGSARASSTRGSRGGPRMTPLQVLMFEEEAENEGTHRRRNTLVNMPVVAEPSDLGPSNHSEDGCGGEALTQEQIQAFQEAFAIFDKVSFLLFMRSKIDRFRMVEVLLTPPNCRKPLKSATSM